VGGERFFHCSFAQKKGPKHLSLLLTPEPFHFIPIQNRLAIGNYAENSQYAKVPKMSIQHARITKIGTQKCAKFLVFIISKQNDDPRNFIPKLANWHFDL
jgi:hypothetical protein